jgi:hypothetical protein
MVGDRRYRAAARQKVEQVAAKLREMKLADAGALVVPGIEETWYYYAFPREQSSQTYASTKVRKTLDNTRTDLSEVIRTIRDSTFDAGTC